MGIIINCFLFNLQLKFVLRDMSIEELRMTGKNDEREISLACKHIA